MKRCALSLVAVALLACSGTAKTPAEPKADPVAEVPSDGPDQATVVADRDLGLSKGSVFDTPVPVHYSYPTEDAGDSKVLPRSFVGAPPLVPHQIEGFLPLVADDNSCYECHEEGTKGATRIPKSHYVDLRNSPGQPGQKLAGARFQCLACHVPQANAPAAVDSYFNPTPQ